MNCPAVHWDPDSHHTKTGTRYIRSGKTFFSERHKAAISYLSLGPSNMPKFLQLDSWIISLLTSLGSSSQRTSLPACIHNPQHSSPKANTNDCGSILTSVCHWLGTPPSPDDLFGRQTRTLIFYKVVSRQMSLCSQKHLHPPLLHGCTFQKHMSTWVYKVHQSSATQVLNTQVPKTI